VRRDDIPAKLRSLVLDRAEHSCELCGARITDAWRPHHRRPAPPGLTPRSHNTPCNVVALCLRCFTAISDNPDGSHRSGFLLRQTDDPRTTPVNLWGETWVYLTDAGHYAACRRRA
jgi:hypothetical protein